MNEKPNCKAWKEELECCHAPYTPECYNWEYLLTILVVEKNMNKYDAISLIEDIRQEIYG